MCPFSSKFRVSLLRNQNVSPCVYVTQSSHVSVLIFAAFSDVTSPLYCVKKKKGGSNLTGFTLKLWATVLARTPDIEPRWRAASRISPLTTLMMIIVIFCMCMCRRTGSSPSRGCWTSTGVCADQSDFRCTTTMKDFVSTGKTTRPWLTPRASCAEQTDVGRGITTLSTGTSHTITEKSKLPVLVKVWSPPCIR